METLNGLEMTAMRFVIADDHDLVREMVATAVRQLANDVDVLHAGSFARAMELARTAEAIDLILLDLRMPGMNGLAGLKAIREVLPDVPVVILSGEADPDTVRNALKLGAAGFIPKTMRVAAMLGALRLILSGERYLPPEVMQDAAPGEKAARPGFEALTPREREVLSELVKGHANKEIGRNLRVEEVTVALHLRSIYKKLGVGSRTQAVRIALRLGWED